MTGKRFKLIGDTNLEFLMQDKLELPIYDYDNNKKRLSLMNTLDLLNQLSEENGQLKPRVEYLERKIQRERAASTKQHSKWSKEAEEQIQILAEENEQLKQREETLLCEIEDFQELLTKNDSVCHKRVMDLIDVRIKNSEKAIEWGKNMDADYGAMGFHIEMLKKLKKELQE